MSVAELRKQVALIKKRVSEPSQSKTGDVIKHLTSARKNFSKRRDKYIRMGSAAKELVERIEDRFRDLDSVGDEILSLLSDLERLS